jgi:ferrous iron transport protein A
MQGAGRSKGKAKEWSTFENDNHFSLDETARRLYFDNEFQFPTRQGDTRIMFPLGLLSPGEQAEIVSIRDNPEGRCECRVEEMGLRVGKTIEMLTNGSGPILLRVDESRSLWAAAWR